MQRIKLLPCLQQQVAGVPLSISEFIALDDEQRLAV
jgi:hypothetical protein